MIADVADRPKIRYVALGDSYTLGEGVSREESWPSMLVKELQTQGVNIELAANIARTGWLSQHVIELELPLLEKYQADFASLQIGTNDWVQDVPETTFHRNIKIILDKVQSLMTDASKIMLLTIPDFSVTQVGEIFGSGKDIVTGIAQFNDIIKMEADKRRLAVVDIFPVSQGMKGNLDLVALDGLHPSAKEYELWVKEILPVALKLLKGI